MLEMGDMKMIDARRFAVGTMMREGMQTSRVVCCG
jgi:hypothetical protein